MNSARLHGMGVGLGGSGVKVGTGVKVGGTAVAVCGSSVMIADPVGLAGNVAGSSVPNGGVWVSAATNVLSIASVSRASTVWAIAVSWLPMPIPVLLCGSLQAKDNIIRTEKLRRNIFLVFNMCVYAPYSLKTFGNKKSSSMIIANVYR